MKKKTIIIGTGLGLTLLVGTALCGPLMSRVEEAKYTVSESVGAIQIRVYSPMIVAETQVSGDRDQAINQGFRIIADYIFGKNTTQTKVAMTAPVIQQPVTKIAMTAPVTQQKNNGQWAVRFVMPATATMNTLPKPINAAIALKELGATRQVVIRFSGTGAAANLQKHDQELQNFLAARHLKPLSEPTYAFFNPPWTIPFFRRNEIMVEIAH